MPAGHRSLSFRIGLLIVACLPAAALLWRAEAAPKPDAKQVLAAVVTDANVLVNVDASDMPATPDILELGRRATPALVRCLADNSDPQLRADCGDLIGVLGDGSALAALHGALEDWDSWVRRHAVRSLGRIGDPRSVAPLAALLVRDDETRDNRREVLHALGSIASPEALAVLRKVAREVPRKPKGTPQASEADDEEGHAPKVDDLRTAALSELWRNRRLMTDAAMAAELEQALRSDNRRLVLAAVERQATLRSPKLLSPLMARIDDPDVDLRNKVIRAIGFTGDRRAVPALVARISDARDSRLLNNLAFALERIDRRAFLTQAEKLITHKLAVIRMNAAFVVGDVRRPEGAPLLRRALADASDRVRLQAVQAAARLPEPSPLLALALGDRELAVRQAAAEAAATQGDAALLEQALRDGEKEIRALAAGGALSLGSPEALLAKALRDPEEAVREAAIDAAVQHDHPPLAVIAAAVRDPSVVVRRKAVLGAGQHHVAAALPALQAIIDDAKAPLREEAIYAADAASPGGRSDLVFDLLFRDERSGLRQRAGVLLAERADPRVHDFLVECVLGGRCTAKVALPLLGREQDASVIRRLQLAWIRKRDDLGPLLVALRPAGTSPLALAQLETASDDREVLRSAEVLVQLREEGARPVLAARLSGSDLFQRMRIDAALDRLGARDARQRLVGSLDGAPLEWMPQVAGVLAQIEEPMQRAALGPEIARREALPEYQRALAAASVRLAWTEAEVPARLLDALASNRPREREQARRYLVMAKEEALRKAAAAERRAVVREELERLAQRVASRG